MWVVGIVALCQITFLPGAVIFRRLGVTALNPIERIAGIFAASLLANYTLASLFVLLRLNSTLTWWIVIVGEVVYLAITWRRSSVQWTFDLERINELRSLSLESAAAGILLLAGAGIIGYLFYVNWGTIYVGNDDVASWDRWATDWSAGRFPSDSSLYPQLIPANNSITYVLLRTTDVKMFAKALTPLYSLLPVLLYLSLAIRRRSAAYLLGGVFFTWILFQCLGFAFLMYGYVDVPLAFFGFLAFYCIYADPNGPRREAVLAGLIAALGALLTKQGGVYALVAIGGYILFWRSRHPGEKVLRRDAATILAVIVGVSCALWYGVKILRIFQGYENPHMRVLMETLHQGRTYPQRIVATWDMFMHARPYTGPVLTIAAALLVVGSLFVKHIRPVTLYCLFPFLLAYSLFFSYEMRTASLGFPLVALVCGEALHELLSTLHVRVGHGLLIAAAFGAAIAAWLLTGEKGRDLLPASVVRFLTDPWIAETAGFYAGALFVIALVCFVLLFTLRIPAGRLEFGRLLVIAAAVFVLFGAAKYRWDDIVFSQIQRARTTIGDPAVNARLYDAVRDKQITSGIVTDYWFLRALPDIKQLFRQTYCYAPCNMDGLRASITRYPDAGFILMMNGNLSPETREALDRGGEFTTLFLVDGVRMIQVKR